MRNLKKDFKELNFRFTDTGESFSSIKLTIQLLTKSESISPGDCLRESVEIGERSENEETLTLFY